MDLNAVALLNDELWLHRLSEWQKVWSLSLVVRAQSMPKPKSKKRHDPLISDMDWRPDGKVLAVSFQKDIMNQTSEHAGSSLHSSIALIEIETSEVIHVIDLPDQLITCLSWTSRDKDDGRVPDEYTNAMLKDGLIQPLKGLARINARQSTPAIAMRRLTEENLTDLMKVRSITVLNMLSVGTKSGHVFLYALGLLLVRRLRLPDKNPVHSVGLSTDLSGMSVVHEESGASSFRITTFNLPDIHRNSSKLLAVTQIHAEILSFVRYMKDSMSLMLEIWEDINLEIETKLSMYFKKSDAWEAKTPSSDEFMELLVFGNASESLDKFLKDLGEKGLKKLGHSIEMTYTSVQKIVVMNLQRVAYHLMFHLNHLKGLALWTEEFDEVGIDWTQVQSAISACGSFLLKVIEFQQVIDTSIRSVKAFFRWLFTVIYRLYGSGTGDQGNAAPPSATAEIIKISQQDLQLVSEFIEENFEPGPETILVAEDENVKKRNTPIKKTISSPATAAATSPGKRESIFTLDRVGQYLQNQDLCFESPPQNCWIKFLNERPGFPYPLSTDSTSMFPHERRNSLIREHEYLVSCLFQAFRGIEKEMSHQNAASTTTLITDSSMNEQPASAPNTPSTPSSASETSSSSRQRGKKMLSAHVTSVSESCLYTVLCPLTASSSSSTEPEAAGGMGSRSGESIFLVKYRMTDGGGGGFTDAAATRIRFREEADPVSTDVSIRGDNEESEELLRILDLNFYDSESLFLLLGDTGGSRFMAKVPIPLLIEGAKLLTSDLMDSVESANTIELSNGTGAIQYRKLHGINWHAIAVSGMRRVATVISKRKIKIFETDTDFDEEDEDIEEDDSNQIQNLSHVSIAE